MEEGEADSEQGLEEGGADFKQGLEEGETCWDIKKNYIHNDDCLCLFAPRRAPRRAPGGPPEGPRRASRRAPRRAPREILIRMWRFRGGNLMLNKEQDLEEGLRERGRRNVA